MLFVEQTDPHWNYVWNDAWLTEDYCWKNREMHMDFGEMDFKKIITKRHIKIVKKLNLEL